VVGDARGRGPLLAPPVLSLLALTRPLSLPALSLSKGRRVERQVANRAFFGQAIRAYARIGSGNTVERMGDVIYSIANVMPSTAVVRKVEPALGSWMAF
jgi:hypothetical protein